MDIRKLDRDHMGPGNAYSHRLMPWPTLNAPFEGAWCVVHPGDATVAHSHHEYEIFIAMSGHAVLESRGERAPFVRGDIVYFQPHADHQVINDGDRDFEFYALWWDPHMSGRFQSAHLEAAPAAEGAGL